MVTFVLHLLSAFLPEQACAILDRDGTLQVSVNLCLHRSNRALQAVALPLKDLQVYGRTAKIEIDARQYVALPNGYGYDNRCCGKSSLPSLQMLPLTWIGRA